MLSAAAFFCLGVIAMWGLWVVFISIGNLHDKLKGG